MKPALAGGVGRQTPMSGAAVYASFMPSRPSSWRIFTRCRAVRAPKAAPCSIAVSLASILASEAAYAASRSAVALGTYAVRTPCAAAAAAASAELPVGAVPRKWYGS